MCWLEHSLGSVSKKCPENTKIIASWVLNLQVAHHQKIGLHNSLTDPSTDRHACDGPSTGTHPINTHKHPPPDRWILKVLNLLTSHLFILTVYFPHFPHLLPLQLPNTLFLSPKHQILYTFPNSPNLPSSNLPACLSNKPVGFNCSCADHQSCVPYFVFIFSKYQVCGYDI